MDQQKPKNLVGRLLVALAVMSFFVLVPVSQAGAARNDDCLEEILSGNITGYLICEAGGAGRTPAPAADCPTAERRLDVYADPYSVPQGGSTKVFGYGFAPGASLQAFLCSTPVPLGTVVADSAGNIEATLGIPAGTALGAHTIAVVGPSAAGGSQVAYAAIEVTAVGAGTGSTTGSLPTTGSDPGMYVGIGAGLVLLGAAAVFGARRRQQSAA